MFINIGVFFVCIFGFPFACSESIHNDLLPLYESSNEESDTSERAWLLLEDIQGLASLLIKNISQICPLHQPEYLQRAEKIVLSTLAEIYDNEETLWKKIFYENIIPPVRASLEACLRSTGFKITPGEYFRQDYPETIFHLDLKHRSDVSKWQDFRPCIRTKKNSNIYPGSLLSIIDTLWQSFLFGYFGCSDFWGAIREWNYLDLVEEIILRPLYQRWSAKFPKKIFDSVSINNGSKTSNTTSSFEILEILNQTETENTDKKMSLEGISLFLEKCNVMLFLRHTVDPVPCFRDMFYIIRG